MQHLQRHQQVSAFLTSALECSVYVSPISPGLTYEKLLEIGRRVGLQSGEISDAMQQVSAMYFGSPLILPDPKRIIGWIALSIFEEPEFRNFSAYDFWSASMTDSARENGIARARLDREVTIERAGHQSVV